jgi:hypothetical protein
LSYKLVDSLLTNFLLTKPVKFAEICTGENNSVNCLQTC